MKKIVSLLVLLLFLASPVDAFKLKKRVVPKQKSSKENLQIRDNSVESDSSIISIVDTVKVIHIDTVVYGILPLDSNAISSYDAQLDMFLHDFFLTKTAINDSCNDDDFKPIYCSDSLYIARLQRLPYIMEMPYNTVVKGFIESYVKRNTQVGNMLGIGNRYYFSIFEAAFDKYNIPFEMRYLPVIESALNPSATSPVGAKGLWQFMAATGKYYNLEVNSLVDERCDPIKATDAAAHYLSDLYEMYGDWHLVIAAYNCGPGNVAKAIRHANGKRNYWDIYPYLPRETRNYVPIFIAANYIFNYYKEHNICINEPQYELVTDTIMVSDRVHFSQISEVLDISLEELRYLNPQYRADIIPGNTKPRSLVLPMKDINSYAENRDTILAYKTDLIDRQLKAQPKEASVIIYRVKSGDTLGGIAARYRVSVASIKRWNGLRSTTIRIGQKLRIHR